MDVIDVGVDGVVCLCHEVDGALDDSFRHVRVAGGADGLAQGRVCGGIGCMAGGAGPFVDRAEDFIEPLPVDMRARHEGGDLAFLGFLPADEFADVGMVDVDDDHLGGAARGSAGLDGAGGAVADAQEGHEAGGLAAAGKRLAGSTEGREVGAGAGAVLEEPCFAHPGVHDAAGIDQVVLDGLDEAGVWLGPFVGGGRRNCFLAVWGRSGSALGRDCRCRRPSAGRC